MRLSAKQARLLLLFVTLLAFGVRVYQLGQTPPGWSDDELSNVLVIAQKPLQGDYSVYYADATGLEALYHAASALPLLVFGFTALGVRLLSAILGTLTIPLTYQVARRMFGKRLVALTAAAALAFSFWSLIYSRVNLRHISAPVFMLLTFYFFWAALQPQASSPRNGMANAKPMRWFNRGAWRFLPAGTFLGLGFYTYFAARGIPLILAAFCLYLLCCHRPMFRRDWRGFVLMFVTALVIALPLIITLSKERGADARVAEVAAPLTEALGGDTERLQEHVIRTLRMFDADGDDEFLYNIPGRPVFGPLGAILFWTGVLTAGGYALYPFLRGRRAGISEGGAVQRQLGAVFLLLWWAAGIAPGFLSIPAASLGHTILAQSAAYILLALPLLPLQQWMARSGRGAMAFLVPCAGLLIVGVIAWRDLPDYFVNWPAQGNVRFLYRADLADVADYLRENPALTAAGISGLLSGPWDRLALEIEMGHSPLAETESEADQLRWFNPQRAIMLEFAGQPAMLLAGYPVVDVVYTDRYQFVAGETAGGYTLAHVSGESPESDQEICFENGLCWVGHRFDPASGELDLLWRVDQPLQIPEKPLVSKPPPPDIYDGPRLYVFTQLLDEQGEFLVGDDGLWVDPATLQPGDLFMQRHLLQSPLAEGSASLLIGLYDPLTGARIWTRDGQDSILLVLGSPSGD